MVVEQLGEPLYRSRLRPHGSESTTERRAYLDDRGHRLLGVEAEPEESAVPEYDEEREAFAPGKPALGEIDLSLESGRGLEAADGLWLRAGPDDRHIVAELGDAAGVPRGPDLLEEPDRT